MMLRCLCAGLLLLMLSSVGLADGRPNVILVMTDDQGYGDLSCHGNPVLETPHLDRLYEQSVRLTDFHVAPMCTPTRGQLMTGVDALRNGAMNVSSGRTLLRREYPTMANIFAAAGYETGIFGKWHLGDNYPFRPQDRGFKKALWFPSSFMNAVPNYWDNDYFDDVYFLDGQEQQIDGYCTDVYFTKAIQWMQTCARDEKPFFLYLPTNTPHGPLFVPDRYRASIREALESAPPRIARLRDDQKAALVSFLAMISNIDENMGRLEDFLQQSGLRDNTILIFLTDNGSTMGPRYYNAGMRGGKVTLWEGGHRVPCFIRWPNGNLRQAGDVAELTQVQDLLPTLIDLCDLEHPGGVQFDGISLASLLRGDVETLPDRMLVVNYSRMPIGFDSPSPDSPAVPKRNTAAVLWKHWRLLEGDQLYDLQADPRQQNNVIDQHPDVAAKMQQHLDAWWQGVEDRVNVPERIVVGSDHENPSSLSACEWFDVFVDQQRQVRKGVRKDGVWHLEVAQSGQYTIEVYRWPRETDLALTASIPLTKVTDGVYVPGVALPIAQARLKIGDEEFTQEAQPDASSVAFQVSLPSGPTTLQATFLDESGNEICGAYYVYTHRQ